MAVSKYFQIVLNTLQGQTDSLKAVPPERLDWAGSGAMLDLFHQTSGDDRGELVHAIGQVIRKHPAPPAIIAQLIHIASSLDLSEVEPEVRDLQSTSFASQEPVKGAVANYLAYRKLKIPAEAKSVRPTRAAGNGKPKTPKRSPVK
jgi:hypothetical protein